MPIGDLLIAMRHIQQSLLGKVIADQLQADGSLSDKSRWQGQSRQARQIHRNGVNIGQVHGDRIIHFFAQIKGYGRRSWPGNYVHLIKRPAEIIANQPADLLRLKVIGVVITGRQRKSSHQNPALYFRAKSFSARSDIQIQQVLGIFTAVAVTHPIKAGQIRRTFRWRYYIISRNRQLTVRQADFNGFRTQLPVLSDRGLRSGGHGAIQPFAKIFFGQADF